MADSQPIDIYILLSKLIGQFIKTMMPINRIIKTPTDVLPFLKTKIFKAKYPNKKLVYCNKPKTYCQTSLMLK